MTYDSHNIFACLLRKEIPVDILLETEHSLSFPDIAPRAPIHDLVIPKGAYEDLIAFAEKATDLELADFIRMFASVVQKRNLSAEGFRIVINTGQNGGQEVPHLHAHILGGRLLGPILRT